MERGEVSQPWFFCAVGGSPPKGFVNIGNVWGRGRIFVVVFFYPNTPARDLPRPERQHDRASGKSQKFFFPARGLTGPIELSLLINHFLSTSLTVALRAFLVNHPSRVLCGQNDVWDETYPEGGGREGDLFHNLRNLRT